MVSKAYKHFPYYIWFFCFLVNSDEISFSLIEEVEVCNEGDEEIRMQTDINANSTSGTTPTTNNKKENGISTPPNIPQSDTVTY